MQDSKYSRVLVSATIICTLFFVVIPLSTGLANSSLRSAEKMESPTGTDSSIFLPLVMKMGGQETIPINGISITITSPFMPGKLTASEPDDLNQVASAFSPNPFQELSVISIPYGPAPPVEDLPDAEPGGTSAYRNALASFRINQGGSPLPAPTASLFGQTVAGSYSIVDLITSSETEHPTLIAEWVVEEEESLWIIRVVRDLSDGTDPVTFLNSLQNLVIESNGVARQTKMIPSGAEVSKVDAPVQVLGALPVPTWWSGECNSNNHPNSYPLGASYDGLIACGPLGSAKSVNFGVGVTQYEWQCTELAKRYLYLKYGIPPYQANGKDVVNNVPQQYIGSLFERVPNGTPNKSPRVGDVISFGPATTFGHVAVVTSSSVDANGNGTIGIIEQNWSTSGNRSIPVTNWRVGGSMPVSNWLRTSGSGPVTNRVSVASDGTQGADDSYNPSLSADGHYIAFQSDANNLVVGDTNGYTDIFVHNLQTEQTNRVSIASDGTQGNGGSYRPSISGDGRYIAFQSDASNLVPDDANNWRDIFVYDRQTEQTDLVSIASNGMQGNSWSFRPFISGDGRYVAFESNASNLVPYDTNDTWDIFVHDLQTGQTSRVSVASDGTQGNADSWHSSISADGRYIAFHSESSNLVPGDTNSRVDIFVHDWQTGQTSRVSVASDGTQGNGGSAWPSISADGRYVAFESDASNLAPDGTVLGVFVHDRQTGQTNRIWMAPEGTPGNYGGYPPSISADGRFVAFQSYNIGHDVFVHDSQTGQTSLVSVAPDGAQGNDFSWGPSISADGRYVAFHSVASNLVPNDTNGSSDVFVSSRDEQ